MTIYTRRKKSKKIKVAAKQTASSSLIIVHIAVPIRKMVLPIAGLT